MIFSKRQLYNDTIKAKVKEIEKICNEEKIPYFMTFAVENEVKDTSYITSTSGIDADNPLGKDKITGYINVMNGFITVPNIIDKECYEEELEDTVFIPDKEDDEDVIKNWNEASDLKLE